MRIPYNTQRCLFDQFPKNKLGRELAQISRWLDEHKEVYQIAAKDLCTTDVKATGRSGLTVENIVRCAILKQHRQLSYEELAFHLDDSRSFNAFARLGGKTVKKSALQSGISSITETTWQEINQLLLYTASLQKIEDGKQVRIDSTPTAADIHYPSDSTLLYDSVRIMVRLLKQASYFDGPDAIKFCNRLRSAKKISLSIIGVREKKRIKLYRKLISVTCETLSYIEEAYNIVSNFKNISENIIFWILQVNHYKPVIEKIIIQAKRRVINGEKVPADEKIVSLFEEHSNIISKGNRETVFGHKLNLTSGKSGMILDIVVEDGNPSDSSCLIPMIQRQAKIYGEVPPKVAADGGYASKENLSAAKDLGVKDMMFHKKRGLEIEDMVKSKWVYRQLRNFRAGIEGNISCLKRAYGLRRCIWKGLAHFKRYIWSSVVAYNLSLFGRLSLNTT